MSFAFLTPQLLPGILSCIFSLAVPIRYLSGKRDVNSAQWCLSAFLFILGVYIILDSFHYDEAVDGLFAIDAAATITAFLLIPAYCLLIQALTSSDGVTKRELWLLAPAVIYAAVTIHIAKLLSPLEVMDYTQNVLKGLPPQTDGSPTYVVYRLFWGNGNAYLFLFLWLIVIFWGDWRISRYNRLLDEYYSKQEGRHTTMNRMISLIALITLFVLVFIAVMPSFPALLDDNRITLLLCAVETGLVCVIGAIAPKIRFTARHLRQFILDNDTRHSEQAADAFVDPYDLDLSAEQIEELTLIPEELAIDLEAKLKAEIANKYYLNPDVTLPDLAERMGTNRTYLNMYLKISRSQSFSDMTNMLRIEHAKQLLQICPNLNGKELFHQTGYSNYSTFSRNFKKFTGKAFIPVKDTD